MTTTVSDLIPYEDTGWKYSVVSIGTGGSTFAAPAFDDSGWSAGTGAFATSPSFPAWSGETIGTIYATNRDLLVRHHATVPSDTTSLTLYLSTRDRVWVYWNGSLARQTDAWATTVAVPAADEIAVPLSVVPGDNVLAIRTSDVPSGGSFLDARLECVETDVTPTPGVYIDWNDDGFETGANDPVTSDVMSWTITRGASAELTGGSQPGSCTLVLKNVDGTYNPENGSSPIQDKLRDGVRLWIGVNNAGRLSGGTGVNGLFAGRITDITPIPEGGAGEPPTVEIVCEDPLGWYGRTPVRIADARDRSQAELRLAALQAAGEESFDLPDEPRGLPLSSYDGNLLGLLDAINAANGTRHFAKPADNYVDWFTYTARNRWYKVGASADASLDAGSDHVTGTSGWRKTASVVINQQKATFTPLTFPDFRETVWQAETVPITGSTSIVLWATFDDYVADAEVEITSSTGSTAALTPFGRTAKIVISDSGTIRVERLVITGRKVRRGLDQSIVIDDTTSQADPRGVRAGSEISGDLVGSRAAADGIANHIVWRFASPQYRPSLTVQNWLPDQFQLDLLDLIAFTSSQIGVTDRLFEIVGLTHTGVLASAGPVLHQVDYVLQECRVQTPTTYFTWDSSVWDGDDLWAYL